MTNTSRHQTIDKNEMNESNDYAIDDQEIKNGQLYDRNRQLMNEQLINIQIINSIQDLYKQNVEMMKKNEHLINQIERSKSQECTDEMTNNLKNELKDIQNQMINVCKTVDNALKLSNEMNHQLE